MPGAWAAKSSSKAFNRGFAVAAAVVVPGGSAFPTLRIVRVHTSVLLYYHWLMPVRVTVALVGRHYRRLRARLGLYS